MILEQGCCPGQFDNWRLEVDLSRAFPAPSSRPSERPSPLLPMSTQKQQKAACYSASHARASRSIWGYRLFLHPGPPTLLGPSCLCPRLQLVLPLTQLHAVFGDPQPSSLSPIPPYRQPKPHFWHSSKQEEPLLRIVSDTHLYMTC